MGAFGRGVGSEVMAAGEEFNETVWLDLGFLSNRWGWWLDEAGGKGSCRTVDWCPWRRRIVWRRRLKIGELTEGWVPLLTKEEGQAAQRKMVLYPFPEARCRGRG